MSAKTAVLESGATGGMTLEGWCVLAMGALFGLFLLGVWWELRTNLRSIGREAQQRARALARLESRAAFEREMERQAASKRVTALRAVNSRVAPSAPVLAEREQEVASGLGLESVGRILERMAQAAPSAEDEIEVPAFAGARPALNMVRGGKSASQADVAGEEDRGAAAREAPRIAAPRRSRSGQSASRGKARDAVKSSSIGSSALLASR